MIKISKTGVIMKVKQKSCLQSERAGSEEKRREVVFWAVIKCMRREREGRSQRKLWLRLVGLIPRHQWALRASERRWLWPHGARESACAHLLWIKPLFALAWMYLALDFFLVEQNGSSLAPAPSEMDVVNQLFNITESERLTPDFRCKKLYFTVVVGQIAC